MPTPEPVRGWSVLGEHGDLWGEGYCARDVLTLFCVDLLSPSLAVTSRKRQQHPGFRLCKVPIGLRAMFVAVSECGLGFCNSRQEET